MSFLSGLKAVIHQVIPYRSIEQAEGVSTPLSTDMRNALAIWQEMYTDTPHWKLADSEGNVKTINAPATIAAEIARAVLVEAKANVSAVNANGEESDQTTPKTEFLKKHLDKLMSQLDQKLEQGLAAGTMVIKPYIKGKELYFDFALGWDIYVVAFDDDGGFSDVIFRDVFLKGRDIYTRLERHKRIVTNDVSMVRITETCYVSQNEQSLGKPCPLTDVEQWADIAPDVTIENVDGNLFGLFKAAQANNVDITGPMGMSCFSRATELIRDADEQYSSMRWEYKGSELAVFMDEFALKARKGEQGREMAKGPNRLYRLVDADKSDFYQVFAPQIRGEAYQSGFNSILMRIEDTCAISRGTLSDPSSEARTATELKILRQRTYSNVAKNQKALERCLVQTVKAMDVLATVSGMIPAGEYDLSFEWDDSIISDTSVQLQERLELHANGIVSKLEIRMWYFGETESQAREALQKIKEEQEETATEQMLRTGIEAFSLDNPENGPENAQNGPKSGNGKKDDKEDEKKEKP